MSCQKHPPGGASAWRTLIGAHSRPDIPFHRPRAPSRGTVVHAGRTHRSAACRLAPPHYDARAHLVVARPSATASARWQQVGGSGSPAPSSQHATGADDSMYRSGASAIAISVVSTALAAWAMSSVILRFNGSASGAIAASALLLLNPNLLYLQSTPMTEPLLLATAMTGIALAAAWIDSDRRWPAAAGLALAAACLTRYEAWPITAATIGLAAVVRHRRGEAIPGALAASLRLAVFPAVAVALFLVNSRWTVGSWFISGGFFVAENTEALVSAHRVGPVREDCIAVRHGARMVRIRGGGADDDRVRAVPIARATGATPGAGWRRSASVVCLPAGTSVPHQVRRAARGRMRRARRRSHQPSVGTRATLHRRSRRRDRGRSGAPARPRRAGHRRIPAGRHEQRGTSRRDRVSSPALRPSHDHDEHGITRPLHA